MKKKAIINAYFYPGRSKRFNKNVTDLLPTEVKIMNIYSVGMKKNIKKGNYFYTITTDINGLRLSLELSCPDSTLYDWYNDADHNRTFENWQKKTVLKMLSNEVVLSEIEELLNTQQND